MYSNSFIHTKLKVFVYSIDRFLQLGNSVYTSAHKTNQPSILKSPEVKLFEGVLFKVFLLIHVHLP